jgi:DNA modification methylase
MEFKLFNGDCLEELKKLDDNSVNGVVTDPPYGLSKQPDIKEVLEHWLNDKEYKHVGTGFMQNSWDSFVPSPEIWKEVFRVLKPGGHALVFAGTRTQDLMSIALRLAGFEIRDCINYFYDNNYDLDNFLESLNEEQRSVFFKLLNSENGNMFYVFGSGFPKSLNISKAIDKLKGNIQEIIGYSHHHSNGRKAKACKFDTTQIGNGDGKYITKPVSKEAKKYDGYGTGLKPAYEPIIIVRKPISEKNIAENVLRWNTGGLNIRSCNIKINSNDNIFFKNPHTIHKKKSNIEFTGCNENIMYNIPAGRFPANIIHDESEDVMKLFPYTKNGGGDKRPTKTHSREIHFTSYDENTRFKIEKKDWLRNEGSAARYFYCSKASQKERNLGLENSNIKNKHCTVKPLSLITYLVKLISPPEGCVILDPFMGSGTTGLACKNVGVNFIGIEIDLEYFNIAKDRIENYNEVKIKTKDEIQESNDIQLNLF